MGKGAIGVGAGAGSWPSVIRALVAGAALSDATRSVQSGCACGRCERSVPSKRLCLVGVVSGEVGPARGGARDRVACVRVSPRASCVALTRCAAA